MLLVDIRLTYCIIIVSQYPHFPCSPFAEIQENPFFQLPDSPSSCKRQTDTVIEKQWTIRLIKQMQTWKQVRLVWAQSFSSS